MINCTWEVARCKYHLQAASKAFFANRNILCNKTVSLVKCLQFLDKIVTPVACFAAGHRKIYKADLETMDVHFRRLLRSVVGPPSQTNWLYPKSKSKSGLHAIGGPFQGAGANKSILYECYTKLNQIVLCTTKFNERFAMLIPKVAIHSSISPWPQALVPAVRLKF